MGPYLSIPTLTPLEPRCISPTDHALSLPPNPSSGLNIDLQFPWFYPKLYLNFIPSKPMEL